jgi:hypothetical protein
MLCLRARRLIREIHAIGTRRHKQKAPGLFRETRRFLLEISKMAYSAKAK